jgi:hypothetical protein
MLIADYFAANPTRVLAFVDFFFGLSSTPYQATTETPTQSSGICRLWSCMAMKSYELFLIILISLFLRRRFCFHQLFKRT